MAADDCHSSKRHKFVNFRLDFNSITSVFIVTRRLEKHSIFIFHDFLCVFWLLDRSCLHFFSIWFLACVFWHTVYSICFLASTFWHTLPVLKSISASAFLRRVTFWHLYSTHAFKRAISLPDQSCTFSDLRNIPKVILSKGGKSKVYNLTLMNRLIRIEWASEWVSDRVPFGVGRKWGTNTAIPQYRTW